MGYERAPPHVGASEINYWRKLIAIILIRVMSRRGAISCCDKEQNLCLSSFGSGFRAQILSRLKSTGEKSTTICRNRVFEEVIRHAHLLQGADVTELPRFFIEFSVQTVSGPAYVCRECFASL